MTLTTDIAALCRAIDDGDDACLPILADALEEAGDARMLMVRAVTTASDPWNWPAKPRWFVGAEKGEVGWKPYPAGLTGCTLSSEIFSRLRGGREIESGRVYPTRSAAFLALAEALADA